MDLLTQSSLLVGVTNFGFGASVLARNVKNKLFLAFFGLTTLISGWALTFFLEKIWGGGNFYRWHLLFNIWLSPVAVFFIQVMARIQGGVSRRFLEISIVSSLILSSLLFLDYGSNLWVRQLIYFAPFWIVLQLGVLILDVPHQSRRLNSRRGFIYFGGLFVLVAGVMDHVPWMGRVIPFIGNLGLTVYIFFISQAITHQRFLNFEALVSRFLVLLAIALTLTVVYSILFAWIQSSTSVFFLNSFIISFLLVTLLEPIRSMVSYFTQRLLTQRYLKLHEQVREAQRRLTGIIDFPPLFHGILNTLDQTLQPTTAAIYVLRSDGTKYRRVRVYEKPLTDYTHIEPAPREIIVDHPLLQYCERLHRRGDLPIALDQVIENELDRSASRVQRDHLFALLQGLKALHSNLLIPLYDHARILGFVALQVEELPESWANNWGLLRVIYPYFEQVAHTLRGMEVYVRQREKERLATLGEMAAGLAHEIRNPLGAIKGAAQFLDPSADRPDSRFLGIIVEEVDRLNRVVTQFLDYSKPSAVDLFPVEISELTRKTIEIMNASIPEGIQVELVDSRQPVMVSASSEQIRQVLINLIQNSVKSILEKNAKETSSPGLIRVSVEPEGSEVSIVVEDNGKGIKKEHLDKLFIPFFTTSPSGTGLGLSISHKIIEAHRGRIEISTEEGRFARFSVVLPILAQSVAEI